MLSTLDQTTNRQTLAAAIRETLTSFQGAEKMDDQTAVLEALAELIGTSPEEMVEDIRAEVIRDLIFEEARAGWR